MSKNYKIILSLFTLFILIFSTLNMSNFRIDASSDTLVAQNDKDLNILNIIKMFN